MFSWPCAASGTRCVWRWGRPRSIASPRTVPGGRIARGGWLPGGLRPEFCAACCIQIADSLGHAAGTQLARGL